MLTEKQETNRAPTKPVEVSYVNADSHLDSNGYWFNFPNRWGSHPSMGKAIGLRRLQYTPCMTAFTADFSIEARLTDDDYAWTRTGTVNKYYTSKNTLDEILDDLQTTLTDLAATLIANDDDAEADAEEDAEENVEEDAEAKFAKADIAVSCHYDGSNVVISCTDRTYADEDVVPLKFILAFDSLEEKNSFLKIFNQEEATDNTAIESTSDGTLTYTGAWNRQDLYFHASFSDATRQIIGSNGDFWPEPSVYYAAALNSDRFALKYSQDTSTYIIPRYGTLFMQFSLVFNYNRDA